MMTRLEIITGVVQNLKIAKGYEDLVFTQTDKSLAGAAAIGAAAIGQFFNSANLSSVSTGSEIDMEFFICVVNSTPLAGRFHKVEFKEGETVEFVVEHKAGGGIVHAARSPSQRMLWMLPYQTRGHIAQKISDIKWTLIISITAVICIIFSEFYFFSVRAHRRDDGGMVFFLLMFLGFVFVNFVVRRRFHGFSLQATEVLKALGYQNPAKVDLHSQHKQAQKKLHQETGKLPPLVQPWSYRY
jgi:hypothetical protein